MLVVLARHGHSTLNVEGRVNGDPAVPVNLTEQGREQGRALGLQVANVPFDLCLVTRFARTRQTAEAALAGRNVPVEVEPLLDDIDIGELEGYTIDDYRAWKREHSRGDPFPGGESLNDAARRYAQAFRLLLERGGADHVFVVTHEIPIRYALNAAAGASGLDAPVHEIPNAAPFLFDGEALARAADGIQRNAA